MPENKYIITHLPQFTGRNVPIQEIAKAMGKDPQYVRIGLQKGIFKFGYAIKRDGSSEFSYYCPDRKVWEEIGYYRLVKPKKKFTLNEGGTEDVNGDLEYKSAI